MSDDTRARAVRRAHLAYSDALVAAVRAGLSTETLLSWGIPWTDINRVLYAKGRLVQSCASPVQTPCRGCLDRDTSHPSGLCPICRAVDGCRVCSCGHGEGQHDDTFIAAALEGPRACREVGCVCRTFVEYVRVEAR